MARQTIKIALVVVLATVLWASVAAQSTDCTNVIISMSPCLNYITGNSSTPSTGCCTQLATVVRSQPECLCQVLNGGGSSLGLNVNQTQALALPNLCKVQTPSISRCNGAGASPAGSPPGSPDTPTTEQTGGGSNTVPTTDSGSSDATSTKLAAPLAFLLLFVASYASTTTLF